MIDLVGELLAPSGRDRERAADIVTDSSWDEPERMILCRSLVRARLCEADSGAAEAQLNALVWLATTGSVDRSEVAELIERLDPDIDGHLQSLAAAVVAGP